MQKNTDTSRMEEIRAAFANPADEYSPFPFWFQNDELTEEEISCVCVCVCMCVNA